MQHLTLQQGGQGGVRQLEGQGGQGGVRQLEGQGGEGGVRQLTLQSHHSSAAEQKQME